MRSVIIGCALVALFAGAAAAQQKDQAPPAGNSSGESSSTPNGPPAPPADTPPDSGTASPAPASATKPKSAPAPPAVESTTYDPVTAEQDVEVGQFYMRKGDIDAAIGRFQDAIRLRANFAKPRLLAAQAFEKKGENAEAVKYYKDYLKVFPHAPDAKKVQGRIEKLSAE